MLDRFMQDLQIEMELDHPFPSEVPGVWSIPLGDELDVIVSKLEDKGFTLRSSIGTLPENKKETFIELMMVSNFMGRGTEEGALGIEEDEQTVVLVRTVEKDTDYQEFKDILEDFLNAVEAWHEELQEQQPET